MRLAGLRGAVGLQALDRLHVKRGRQVVKDRVEQGLNALVLERGATQHRGQLAGKSRLADRGLELVDRNLSLIEDQLDELVVEVGDLIEQVLARLCGSGLELVGDLTNLMLLAEVVRVDDRVVLDQVDDPDQIALSADGQLDRHRVGAEAVDHGLDGVAEVGADAVHLVHEGDARDVVLVGLAPDRLGLRLYAGDRVEQRDGAVEHSQRALHLDGEVDVARGVNDVDAGAVPLAGGRSRRDRDAALLLLLHPVHGGCALMDLTDLVGTAGVEKDALSRRRFTGVDVGHDPDVAGVCEAELAGHLVFRSSSFVLGFRTDFWTSGLAAGVKKGPRGPSHDADVATGGSFQFCSVSIRQACIPDPGARLRGRFRGSRGI